MWKWLFDFRGECKVDRMMTAARARDALLASSMKLYRQLLQDESLDCEWQDQGLLMVYKSKHEFDAFRETSDFLKREFSVETVAYTGEEVRELEPALREGMAGGWHFTGDAHVVGADSRDDGIVEVVASWTAMSDTDRKALAQLTADLAFLREHDA